MKFLIFLIILLNFWLQFYLVVDQFNFCCLKNLDSFSLAYLSSLFNLSIWAADILAIHKMMIVMHIP